jgi:hypothetical protein
MRLSEQFRPPAGAVSLFRAKNRPLGQNLSPSFNMQNCRFFGHRNSKETARKQLQNSGITAAETAGITFQEAFLVAAKFFWRAAAKTTGLPDC